MPYYEDSAFKLDDSSKELVKEMGEDPAQKMSQLEVLKTWIMSHKYLECPIDDKFLLRFLRVSKFSCEVAKDRITKYCIARSSKLDGMPEWFRDLDIKEPKLRELIDLGVIYYMPRPDDLGRIIIVFEISPIKNMKLDPVDFVRAIYLILEYVIHKYERSQIHGISFVEAADTFDMSLMSYWTPERLKKSVNFFQGAFPCRVKRIEYYNMPAMLKVFIDAAILLMKPKMQKRVKIHSDFKPPENIPIDLMPKSLGGDAPAFSEIKDELIRNLEDFQSELDMLNMCKVDDAKMPKHYEEGDSWGISGTYRSTESK